MAQVQIERNIRRASHAVEQWRARNQSSLLDEPLDALKSLLQRAEREVSERGTANALAAEFRDLIQHVERNAERLAPELRAGARDLLLRAKLVENQLAPSLEIPSVPLFGVLPLARVIPQDVHSVLDYTNGIATALPVFFADTTSARWVAFALGGSIVSVSSITDYRLSFANVIPIEVHEGLDHVWGACCIAAPFVLGYYKKDPVTAVIHVATGVLTILASLFTDYRSAIGRGHSRTAAAAMMGARMQPGVSSRTDYGWSDR